MEFEAFKGSPLQKSNAKSSKRQIQNGGGNKTFASLLDIDQMWRGSISNLKSSENITEDLIKESIKELEAAMSESKRMLVSRDEEIARLRLFIENNKLNGRADDEEQEREEEARHTELVKQLNETQIMNSKLEKKIHELELTHSKEMHRLKEENQSPPVWHLEEPSSKRPECTCYCGTVCKALKDLVEARDHLDKTKTKYDNLKKRVREFRQQAELEQKNRNMRNHGGSFLRDEDRMSSCSIQ
ncbi:uncharacterized protein [Clytia hemisphaerica]|uniref:uncharacterized protein n=1 Tax=Clytia hemisphaerica TaxID=252671 RepID=UPI0034D5A59E